MPANNMSLQHVYVSMLSSHCLQSLTNHVMIALAVLCCLFPHIYSEEECLKSKVWCYECESSKDPYCSDPFNASMEMNWMKLCEGCCVKIVRERNTPKQTIWRTCTSRLQINLFMVDHVCMEESGGLGHMCFCESDGCNGGNSLLVSTPGSFHTIWTGGGTGTWRSLLCPFLLLTLFAVWIAL